MPYSGRLPSWRGELGLANHDGHLKDTVPDLIRMQCKVTRAYDLPCRLVLHTVGPNRDLHDDDKGYPLLASAYRSCLRRVLEKEVKSVAFSCISTGAYRFPSRPSAHVALSTVRRVGHSTSCIREIHFTLTLLFPSVAGRRAQPPEG